MHEQEWKGATLTGCTKEEFDLHNLNLSIANYIKEATEVEKLLPKIDEAMRIADDRSFTIRPSIRANAFSNAATYYHMLGHDKHAIPYMQKALDIFRGSKLEQVDEVAYAIALANAARLEVGLRLFREAEKHCLEAIEIKERILPKDHHALHRTVASLAQLYKNHMHQPEKADALKRKYQSAFSDTPWRS